MLRKDLGKLLKINFVKLLEVFLVLKKKASGVSLSFALMDLFQSLCTLHEVMVILFYPKNKFKKKKRKTNILVMTNSLMSCLGFFISEVLAMLTDNYSTFWDIFMC